VGLRSFKVEYQRWRLYDVSMYVKIARHASSHVLEVSPSDELQLACGEEAFHGDIVPAVTSPTYARAQAIGLEKFAIHTAGVRYAMIGMIQELKGQTSRLKSMGKALSASSTTRSSRIA
jgi:hypothetical protein